MLKLLWHVYYLHARNFEKIKQGRVHEVEFRSTSNEERAAAWKPPCIFMHNEIIK